MYDYRAYVERRGRYVGGRLGRRLMLVVALVLAVVVTGASGYRIIGGDQWSWLDCIYMTVVTISTVGYEEIIDTTDNTAARVFTIFLVLFGVGIMLYSIGVLMAFLVEIDLRNVLWRRKMSKEIANLRDHYIVCGAGRTGTHIVEELYNTGRSFVVIDNDPEMIDQVAQIGPIAYLEGDATEDDVLTRAGIAEASGLVSALPSDEDNLYVTFTARQLNPKLRIVARGSDPKTNKKLQKAGADSVVPTTYIGALRMVSEMVRPTVVSFIENMLRDQDTSLRFEELTITAGSRYIEKSLRQASIQQDTGLLVTAIKSPNSSEFAYNPDPNTVLTEGMVLVVLGDAKQAQKLRQLM